MLDDSFSRSGNGELLYIYLFDVIGNTSASKGMLLQYTRCPWLVDLDGNFSNSADRPSPIATTAKAVVAGANTPGERPSYKAASMVLYIDVGHEVKKKKPSGRLMPPRS